MVDVDDEYAFIEEEAVGGDCARGEGLTGFGGPVEDVDGGRVEESDLVGSESHCRGGGVDAAGDEGCDVDVQGRRVASDRRGHATFHASMRDPPG